MKKRANRLEEAESQVGVSLLNLLVTFEEIVPSQLKMRGEGLIIHYGIAESPFGPCVIGTTEHGVCALHFGDDLTQFSDDWSGAELVREDAQAHKLATQIFQQGGTAELRAFIRGTRFQISVWEALLQIPPGQVTTYGTIAQAIGKEGASRAVGGAVGSNPISWIIPCHRVIRKSGELGGYRWSSERKSAMLLHEYRAAPEKQNAKSQTSRRTNS